MKCNDGRPLLAFHLGKHSFRRHGGSVCVLFSEQNSSGSYTVNGLMCLKELQGVEFGIRHADKPTQERRKNTSIIDQQRNSKDNSGYFNDIYLRLGVHGGTAALRLKTEFSIESSCTARKKQIYSTLSTV